MDPILNTCLDCLKYFKLDSGSSLVETIDEQIEPIRENSSVASFSKSLIHKLKLNWDEHIIPDKKNYHKINIDECQQSFEALVKNDFNGTGPILIHDPAFIHFLPIWNQIADSDSYDIHYIIVTKKPQIQIDQLKRQLPSVKIFSIDGLDQLLHRS